MTPEQFESIQQNIKETIQTTVNGKIDKLNTKLDIYIKEDDEWKSSVTPSIETMKELQGFASIGKATLKVLVLVGSITTAIIVVYKFIMGK